MPNLSVANSPGILSSHTARTLKTEIREQPESKGGFWDKFKSLSLGQKIGRSSATIGSGLAVGGGGLGIAMAAGLGLGLATGGIALLGFGIGALGFYGVTRLVRSSKEQARVVRQDECRPRETKVQKSAESLPERANIPLQATIVLGAADRQGATAYILEQVCDTGIEQGGPAIGLSKAFLPDLNRAEFTVQTSDGRTMDFGRSAFQKAGKDLSKLSDGDKSAVVDLFKNAIASEPSLGGDQDKIAKWQKAASGFMNQISPIGAQGFGIKASKLQLTERTEDYLTKYNLRIEPGGNSAILECTENGGINGINTINENDRVDGNSWSDDETALELGIDRDSSALRKVTVLRITLEDGDAQNVEGAAKQVRDGVGLEVLSYSSNHSLGLMSKSKMEALQREIAARKPAGQAPNEQPLDNAAAARLLRDRARGMFGMETDRGKNINLYIAHLGKQADPDFSAFREAYSELDGAEEKQCLFGDLAGVVKESEFLRFMELPRESDEPDPGLARQIQSEVRLQADYPLGTQNVLSPEKGPVAKSGRDWDIQNFVHRKFEEEVAQKHLGIGPEEFYATIKESMGPVGVLTSRYLSEKELPPHLETLRSQLLESFDQSTTLDDFYTRAGKIIAQAKLESA